MQGIKMQETWTQLLFTLFLQCMKEFVSVLNAAEESLPFDILQSNKLEFAAVYSQLELLQFI